MKIYFTFLPSGFNTGSDDSDTTMISEHSFNPAPNAASTLKCKKKKQDLLRNLKIMCIDCNRLRSVDKCAELSCHHSHVILCLESTLGPDISSCEVFPKGFKSFYMVQVTHGVTSSSWSEKTLTMLRMLFWMSIKAVRLFAFN